MRILLDTHFLIWLVNSPELITKSEYAAMARRDEPLIVSAITIWELRIKWGSLDRHGRSKGQLSPESGLAFAEGSGFTLAPLLPADCVVQIDPSVPHKDPFDQMMMVHAHQLRAKLLTRDRKLRSHPLAVQL